MNTTTANPQSDHDTPTDQPAEPRGDIRDPQAGYGRALERPATDRMIAGVASGLARYLGVDVTIVRIAIAVLTVAGGAGLPLYLAGWLLIPEEGHEQSLADELLDSWQARRAR
jgi:phage shock protein PspC (stress-responsive transcriptional regulator)